MNPSTIVEADEYDILTPMYISTLSTAQITAYRTQITSTVSGLDAELIIDNLDILTSGNQLSTDTVIATLAQSTLDGSIVALSISDAAYLALSTNNTISSITDDSLFSTTSVSTNLGIAQLDSDISTLTSQYILASTSITPRDAGGISTLLAYDAVLADFYGASTISADANKDYINYSNIYTSTVTLLDTATLLAQSTNTVYLNNTSTLQAYNDEYVTLNINYLNAQTLATQSGLDLNVATMNLSSAVAYQTLAHLNADNINLSIRLQSTIALLPPATGLSAAENLANKALADTLQERLTSTINALSSIGIYASSLSIQAQDQAILAVGISTELYTSSINNYSTLAAQEAKTVNSVVSTQVSYLNDAAIYNAQALSTQRGMSSIYILAAQQNSTVLSYTTKLDTENSKLAAAYLTYSSQTLLAESFTSSIANYTSSVVGYSTFLTMVDSQMVTYLSVKLAADNTVKMISSQIISSKTAYTANDTIYRVKRRAVTRSLADTSLYDSQVLLSQVQSQASEYAYKQAKSRFYRIPADTAFTNVKVLYDTAAQISTATNAYESQYNIATSTLIAWNKSVSMFDATLQLFSTFVPVCTEYVTKVSARVASQKVLVGAQEAADINPTGADVIISAATQELADTTAAENAAKDVLTIQQKQVAASIIVADSSWLGLMDPAAAISIQSTINYYR